MKHPHPRENLHDITISPVGDGVQIAHVKNGQIVYSEYCRLSAAARLDTKVFEAETHDALQRVIGHSRNHH